MPGPRDAARNLISDGHYSVGSLRQQHPAKPYAAAVTNNPLNLPAQHDAYYLRLADGTYQPTLHVQGAWLDYEQHMAPVGGLITHALERYEPRDDLQLARVSFEILGQMPAKPTRVDVEIIRPGRTIELMAATMVIDDRIAVRAQAWRLALTDTGAIAGHELEPMPAPETVPAWDIAGFWSGGYIDGLEVRRVEGSRPGRGRAWLRSPYDLVQGEPTSPAANFLRLVDTANGIATRVSPQEWMFPNTDLTVHLFRSPEAPWVGLDTTVSFGPSGVGLTSSVLHDIRGPVGRAEQILTIRRQPG